MRFINCLDIVNIDRLQCRLLAEKFSLSRNREEVLIPEWNILNYRVLASYPNYKKLRGTRASKFCTILNIYIYIETKEEREVTISNRMERWKSDRFPVTYNSLPSRVYQSSPPRVENGWVREAQWCKINVIEPLAYAGLVRYTRLFGVIVLFEITRLSATSTQ